MRDLALRLIFSWQRGGKHASMDWISNHHIAWEQQA